MPELLYLKVVLTLLRAHVAELRQHSEDGYTTETLIITAALALAAAAAVVVIVAKIRSKARQISGA
jgi:hypothetical protein